MSTENLDMLDPEEHDVEAHGLEGEDANDAGVLQWTHCGVCGG